MTTKTAFVSFTQIPKQGTGITLFTNKLAADAHLDETIRLFAKNVVGDANRNPAVRTLVDALLSNEDADTKHIAFVLEELLGVTFRVDEAPIFAEWLLGTTFNHNEDGSAVSVQH